LYGAEGTGEYGAEGTGEYGAEGDVWK